MGATAKLTGAAVATATAVDDDLSEPDSAGDVEASGAGVAESTLFSDGGLPDRDEGASMEEDDGRGQGGAISADGEEDSGSNATARGLIITGPRQGSEIIKGFVEKRAREDGVANPSADSGTGSQQPGRQQQQQQRGTLLLPITPPAVASAAVDDATTVPSGVPQVPENVSEPPPSDASDCERRDESASPATDVEYPSGMEAPAGPVAGVNLRASPRDVRVPWDQERGEGEAAVGGTRERQPSVAAAIIEAGGVKTADSFAAGGASASVSSESEAVASGGGGEGRQGHERLEGGAGDGQERFVLETEEMENGEGEGGLEESRDWEEEWEPEPEQQEDEQEWIVKMQELYPKYQTL